MKTIDKITVNSGDTWIMLGFLSGPGGAFGGHYLKLPFNKNGSFDVETVVRGLRGTAAQLERMHEKSLVGSNDAKR